MCAAPSSESDRIRHRGWVRDSQGGTLREATGSFADHAAAVHAMFDAFEDLQLPEPAAAGHRIVHGGPSHTKPERIDRALLATLRDLVPYAPLHLPCELGIIAAVAARFADLPQVACFDTAFHRGMPDVAQRFPLPQRFLDRGSAALRFPRALVRIHLERARGSGRTNRAMARRWQACEGLGHLGIRLDAAKNDAQEGIISLPEAPCTVRVMTTDEDRIIARHVRRVLFG